MHFDIKGLVLRETAVGENDSYLEVLTSELGRISVFARGVRSYRSRNREATLPLSYSEFTLDRQKEDFTVMTEAQKAAVYGTSSKGLAVSAFSMYVLETVREFALPDVEQDALLRLALNTLHAAHNKPYPLALVKAAYEIRLLADEGYAPDLSGCERCGKTGTDDMYLDVMNGSLICSPCLTKSGAEAPETADPHQTATVLAPVSLAAVEAMKYVIRAPLSRLFSFRLEGAPLAELSAAGEKYILNHLERSFPTLDFYKQVEGMTAAEQTKKEPE